MGFDCARAEQYNVSVPIATVDRNILRQLADIRLAESAVLIASKMWTGAYYLAGLSVECALKSYHASAVKQYDYPNKDFILKLYSHGLEDLLSLDPTLKLALQTDAKANQKLAVNWSTVKDWKIEKRYEIIPELDARGMYDAVSETGSGVMAWIKTKW